MKKFLPVLLICACAFSCYGQPADVARYAEFARTYGVVRYFSPNPYVRKWSESDWMKVCALLAHRAEEQPLDVLFRPLAPAATISDSPVPKADADAADHAQYCCHSGSGALSVPFLARLFYPGLGKYIPYYSKLETATGDPTAPTAGKYYAYPLSESKYLHIRHALPEEAFDRRATQQLLADATDFWNGHRYEDKNLSARRRFLFGLLSDRTVRIADITARWNIVRHFYPYYEEIDPEWERRLKPFLQEAVRIDRIASLDAVFEWHRTVCRFFNPIKDGHLTVSTDMAVSGMKSAYLPEYYVPVSVLPVNDTILVRDSSSPHAWRILQTIDGVPATERLREYADVSNAATDEHRNRIAASRLFVSPTFGTSFVIVSQERSGSVRCDTLYAARPEPPRSDRHTEPFRKLENGILYIDAASDEATEKRFLAALTSDIKGLCFDLRSYPSYKFEEILAHLLAADSKAPATEVPIARYPFRQQLAWRIEAETLPARSPRVSLPATFLCDAGTFSWGETILLIVRHYRLGKIVGEPTAGTTGDLTRFELPIFPFSMTGMKMTGMDGEPHHAVGIIPDIVVPVFAADRMNGCDPILQTALTCY